MTLFECQRHILMCASLCARNLFNYIFYCSVNCPMQIFSSHCIFIAHLNFSDHLLNRKFHKCPKIPWFWSYFMTPINCLTYSTKSTIIVNCDPQLCETFKCFCELFSLQLCELFISTFGSDKRLSSFVLKFKENTKFYYDSLIIWWMSFLFIIDVQKQQMRVCDKPSNQSIDMRLKMSPDMTTEYWVFFSFLTWK